jgi:hypothetical protein
MPIDARTQLRLDILDQEIALVRDQRSAARLLIIVAEGVHEGLFSVRHLEISDTDLQISLSLTNSFLVASFEHSFSCARSS